MKEFTLRAFAQQLTALEVQAKHRFEAGLEAVAIEIEQTAKAQIGEYQEASGPFSAWTELAESTKTDRLRRGYTENDPGLRSGAMRESIEHKVEGLDAVVGSNDDKLVYFEFGTSRQPPRPVLGMAKVKTDAGKIVAKQVVKLFRGGK